jgi:hypothetical protein
MTRWLPLSDAVLCLNDETVFSIRDRECPICGSKNYALLQRWLDARRHVS